MPEINEIEPAALKQRLDHGDALNILDVREPGEVQIAAIPGTVHIPMNDIPGRLAELDREKEWVVMCHHGIRSAQVAMYLARMGFRRVANLSGGIEEWSLTVDPTVPRY
jgi:rhodanese-related sulfurtransferase